MNRTIAIIILMIFVGNVFPQAVVFTSAVVGNDGNVTLSWQYNGDSETFMGYDIEKFQNNSYQNIATYNDINTRVYTDNEAYADNAEQKYRIVAHTSTDSFYDSTTTIYIDVANTSTNNISAYLSWNNPFISANTSPSTYRIYRMIQNKTDWQLIDTTSMLHYSDTITRSICNDTVLYRIICVGSNDTTHISNSEGKLFADPLPTTPCSLDVITIDEDSQKIHLSWHPSSDADIWGYFICQGSPCMALDTIYGKYDTNYIAEHHSSTSIYDYRIYAFDSCFTASALTEYYHNIVVSGGVADCSNTIDIHWNQYINMPDDVDSYIVYVRYSGEASFRQVAHIAASSPLNYRFDVPIAIPKAYVKVVAINGSQTKRSESNTLTVNMAVPDTANFIYTRLATVAEDNSAINLTFYVDTSFATTEYLLYRKENTLPYTHIASLPSTSQPYIYYTDTDVDPSDKRYHYYLSVKDACGISEKKSNIVSPIYIQLKSSENVNQIIRTNYIGWDSVAYYKVFRKQKNDLLWSDIATLQPWEYAYNDNLNNISNLKDNLIYRVEAYEAPSHWEESYTSSSQSETYTREGDIWISNSFTPQNDNNKTFGPVATFTRQDNYLFQIYNRMGLMIFQTTDINHGWDGRFNGEYVPQGSYVYIIYCTFSDGTSHVEKGTVTVIR